jgi:hypothetical protein
VPFTKTEMDVEVERLLSQKERRRTHKKDTAVKPVSRLDEWDRTDFAGCPFDKLSECRIWKQKPMVSETVSIKQPQISEAHIATLATLLRAGNRITSDMPDARPLVNRYRALLMASKACCTSGLVYNLQMAGADKGVVYKFLVDDANFYQFGERCTMITDKELDTYYGGTATAMVVADVRNTCLCRNRVYFESLLEPFVQLANASPDFAKSAFGYSYKDGLNRHVTVSINHDVNTVLNQLRNCPG